MGNYRKTLEILYRSFRYLNYRQKEKKEITVNGYELTRREEMEALQPEKDFEKRIATIYSNRKKYRLGFGILTKKWKVLDYILGTFERRNYKYFYRYYDDRGEACRKDYAEYMGKEYDFYNENGERYQLKESKYNEEMLTRLLPPDHWQRLQAYKYGPDFCPSEGYERIEYRKPWEHIPAPPTPVLEWLAEIGQVTEFERKEIG